MTTPTIRDAQTSDDILPGPFSENDLCQQWNAQADDLNQWDQLATFEQLAWAQACAITADRCARKALDAESEGPSDEQIANLADEFYGDPVPTVRRALELWGASAAPPAPEPGEAGELAARLTLISEGMSAMDQEEDSWFVARAATVIQQQAAELATLRKPAHPTYLDAIRLAQGCHDYSGGHSGTHGEAFQNGVGTVVAVLKQAAVGPWDSQTVAVFAAGLGAQAVEAQP